MALTILLSSFSSCSSDNDGDSINLEPSNLSITSFEINTDRTNPNEDGSGVVNYVRVYL